ncbi:MAG: hypothetical protein K0S07_956 [Chlamydiales bacterium]|jgi:hypothetical protein|nr:hypothetical protein [Chlamydiales bacterium]
MTRPLNQPHPESIQQADEQAAKLVTETDALYPRILYLLEKTKDLAKEQQATDDEPSAQLKLLLQAEESWNELLADIERLRTMQETLLEMRKKSLSANYLDSVVKALGAVLSFLDDILPAIEEAKARHQKLMDHGLGVLHYSLSPLNQGMANANQELQGGAKDSAYLEKLKQMRPLLHATTKIINKRLTLNKEDAILNELRAQLEMCNRLLR